MEKKNVYLIRWPQKAPGFCQYKKGSKMTRAGDMEQAQKEEGRGTSDHRYTSQPPVSTLSLG